MSNTISSQINSTNLASILQSGALANIGAASTNTSSTPNLAVSGLASGMNWQTIVQELATAERSPEIQWQHQQTNLSTQKAAYTTIGTDLAALQADLKALQDPTLYQSSMAQSSNTAIATAATAANATTGSFSFNIQNLATAASVTGTPNISQTLAPGGNLGVSIATAGFSTPVNTGTFTVDGAQVTIGSTDTLQTVFNNIATATGNKVSASYNSTTDEITLASSDGSAVALGSAADTSNFLQVAQLYSNNTNSVTSASALGRVNTTTTMTGSGMATAVTDGGSGHGAFTINGVSINYNATADSVQNVLGRINSSTAGVTASYDSVNNRFLLTNNSTGNVGISMQDVTGNFLAATGLTGGTTTAGTNLKYTLNGSSQVLQSQSNTITPASSGINGLSVTALAASPTTPVTITVSNDTSKVSTAINQFVTDYNAVQNYISSQQIVSTSSSGAVTPGPLTGDQTANNLSDTLRASSFFAGAGLSSSITNLGALGIQTNGQTNTLAVSDTTAMSTALSTNLSSVQSFFADATKGMATLLNNSITNLTGPSGALTNHQASLTAQNTNIATQISNLENKITSDSAQWTKEFTAMEQAQSSVNQQLTYLSEQVTNGSL